jgi:hypothetical protein
VALEYQDPAVFVLIAYFAAFVDYQKLRPLDRFFDIEEICFIAKGGAFFEDVFIIMLFFHDFIMIGARKTRNEYIMHFHEMQ